MSQPQPPIVPTIPKGRPRLSPRTAARKRIQARRGRPGLKVLVVLLGTLVAVVLGTVIFFTVGERTGVVAFAAFIALSFLVAAMAPPPGLILTILIELALLAWAGFFIAGQATAAMRAFSTTEGPVATADSDALAAAQEVLSTNANDSAFRLDLHEDEITALLQNALAGSEQPLRQIIVDIVDDATPGEGHIDFHGEFKSGDYTATGSAAVEIEAGVIHVEVLSIELGAIKLPDFAESAIEDYVEELVGSVNDINILLQEAEVDVQSIDLGGDRIVITGVQQSGALITSQTLLNNLAAQAPVLSASVMPPPEVLGPGVVNGTYADGSVFYVALGDSLAANAGVANAFDGYVSRLHNQLQLADGREYGLLNTGISGETSGTLVRSGQLDTALEFLQENRVAYITIDIGANDLLGHLSSADCGDDFDAPACQERVASAINSYETNIQTIFRRLRQAAPEATIVFIRAYNPFSLGTGIEFERRSSDAVDALNDSAAGAATDWNILVADAFTLMERTTAVTTHVLDSPPDIHPNPLGYDIIAQAALEEIVE
jgi:lysophospholipase L1-like esterase